MSKNYVTLEFQGPYGPPKNSSPCGGRLASLAALLASLELLGVNMIKNWKINRFAQNSKLATKKSTHSNMYIDGE